MSLKHKAIAYFKKNPTASAAALAKRFGISTSYAHKLKALAIDWIAEDYNTRPDVIIERGWTVTTTNDGQMIAAVEQRSTPLDTQVAGSHYKGYKIQPVEFIHTNKIPFMEGCAIKYLIRHREKGGEQDIRKVIHYCQLILKLEYGRDE